MSFNPSEQRAPAGSAGGGQWTADSAPSKTKASTKPPAKATTAARKTTAKAPKLGPARNAAAAKIQQDKQAQQLYAQMLGMSTAAEQAAYAKKLPPDQLEKLTQILYSSHTSDPQIVKARVVVANEMGKRGLDVKKYGALGGGPSATRKVSPAQAKAVAHARARSAAAKAANTSAPAKATPAAAAGPGRKAI